jgi:hypothetical protein
VPSQRDHVVPPRLDEAQPPKPGERFRVDRVLEPLECQRLVEAQAEEHTLGASNRPGQRLDLTQWPLSGGKRCQVGAETRRRPPAATFDCRDRTDAEAEVVPSPPVGEVVPRAEVATVHELRQPAEVRRLVPAVAGRRQQRDDALEVGLHRLGLARELDAVRMGEARPLLRLQLVAGEVLRPERERLAQVGVEVGGALAGDPVDEIERYVVNSGITKIVDRAPDVVGPRLPLEHLEQPRPEALCPQRDPVHPAVP